MALRPQILDDRRCLLGEGPTFDAHRNRLWWVDILTKRILWRCLASGRQGHIDVADLVGAVILRADGNLTACLRDRVISLDAETGKELESVSMPAAHGKSPIPLRMNDAKCSPEGVLYAGSMFIEECPEAKGASALYRIQDTSVHLVLPDVTLSNGLGWSPDGSAMYYIDTRTQRIDRFDYSPQTGPTNRRTFVEIPETDGNPDGLCTDQDGGVWVALWGTGKVVRFEDSGRLSQEVVMPTPQPTSVCFFGENLDYLAITTASVGLSDHTALAGLTFGLQPGISGCVVGLFSGLGRES